MCDSFIGTLIKIQGKAKDGKTTRLNLLDMGIIQELAPKKVGKRTYFPPNMSHSEYKKKKMFLRVFARYQTYSL